MNPYVPLHLMTMPMALLAWASFLALLHGIATGAAVTSEHGMEYASGPRDEQRPVSVRRARLIRAFGNLMQSFPIFAAAVLVAHGVNKDHGLATWGAQIWFWARIAYLPAYVFGWKYRTQIFLVSVLGLLLIFLKLA